MMRLSLVVPIALLAGIGLIAEVRMSVQQLRSFVQSSKRLGHPDKQVAEYLKTVKVTEKLPPGIIEDMQAEGAGPKTTEVLRRLAEGSKNLPAPAPAAPKQVVASIAPPSSEEQAKILAQVREYATDYSKKLPNFICTQVTRRYVDPSGLEFWQQQDVVTAKLSYFEQKEDYKIVLVNNHLVNTTQDRLGGATSTGEFGSMLRELFQPSTKAEFEWERWATLRGKRMHVYSYRVPQATSKWHIQYEKTQDVVTAYRGLIYVDKNTLAIMRMTAEAQDLPFSFPVQQALSILDYEWSSIAGTEYILPLKATMRMRTGKVLIKNDVEFRMYNRFGAEATITYTPDALSEDQTKEQPAPANPPQ